MAGVSEMAVAHGILTEIDVILIGISIERGIASITAGNAARTGTELAGRELLYSQEQVWKKFGEHFKQFSLKHSKDGYEAYLKLAQEVAAKPDKIVKVAENAAVHAGETQIYKGYILLRLDANGYFRNMCLIK